MRLPLLSFLDTSANHVSVVKRPPGDTVQAHEYITRGYQAGCEVDHSLLPGYYNLFRTILPSTKTLVDQMRKDEKEKKRFNNFDVKAMLSSI